MTHQLAPGLWQSTSPPENVEVDLFFVNPSFDPPIAGVTRAVRIKGDDIRVANGDLIFMDYVKLWKMSSGQATCL